VFKYSNFGFQLAVFEPPVHNPAAFHPVSKANPLINHVFANASKRRTERSQQPNLVAIPVTTDRFGSLKSL
jgi:hypothetical protein